MSFTIDMSLLQVSLFRIFLSFCGGLLLGFERKVHRQVIGMRTLILISVSSCLLGMLSCFMAGADDLGMGVHGDPTRIASTVVSGIGFLGGGAIIIQGLNIRGLTSAAIIWAGAATGLSFGAGLYIPAMLTVLVSLLSLIVFEKIEDKFFPAAKNKSLHMVFDNDKVDVQQVNSILEKHGLVVADINLSRGFKSKKFALRCTIKSPRNVDYSAVSTELNKLCELNKFAITD